MIVSTPNTPVTPVQPTPTPAPSPAATSTPAPAADPRAGTGVQGVIGDLLRGAGSGYQQASKMSAVQADKAAIHPFEAVETATGLLKQKTANVKYVNKATGLLHTIGGFAMLIVTANASGVLRSPGQTGSELAHKVADMIDGRETSTGFTPGWFMTPPQDGEQAPEGAVGSALGSLGMK
jgi:hypothetical protein